MFSISVSIYVVKLIFMGLLVALGLSIIANINLKADNDLLKTQIETLECRAMGTPTSTYNKNGREDL